MEVVEYLWIGSSATILVLTLSLCNQVTKEILATHYWKDMIREETRKVL